MRRPDLTGQRSSPRCTPTFTADLTACFAASAVDSPRSHIADQPFHRQLCSRRLMIQMRLPRSLSDPNRMSGLSSEMLLPAAWRVEIVDRL